MKIKHLITSKTLWYTIVYAKTTSRKRKKLWYKLRHNMTRIEGPWAILGDFNVILSPNKEKGGRDHRMNQSMDFISFLDDCGQVDAGYSGNIFTWSNGRKRGYRICKRLDRILYNEEWNDIMGTSVVIHRAKIGFDHNIILFKCNEVTNNFVRYFRFLNFWTMRPDFQQVVQDSWKEEVNGNPMWILQEKLKRFSKVLSQWSRETIGDVFENVKRNEELIMQAEQRMETDDIDNNRHELNRVNAEYIKWINIQDNLLQQKANIQWNEEGNSCTKYFFSTIKHKRRKATLHWIRDSDGFWIEGNEAIGGVAVNYFQKLFTETDQIPDFGVLNHIEKLIDDEDNQKLNKFLEEYEIKKEFMDVSPNSAAGPYGFNGLFFQKCWNIIKVDLINFVHSFYCGKNLTKYFTHTCLVFIPKIEEPSNFSQLRPISLTNFSNKIISKIIASRIKFFCLS